MTRQQQQQQQQMSNNSYQHQQSNKQTHSYQLRSTKMKSIITTTTTTTKIVTSSAHQLNNNTLTGQRKTCGLFNTDQSQSIDTGTKETELSHSKSTEMESFFDSNMDEKLNFDDCCFLNFTDNLAGFGGDNNLNSSSLNATTPTSTCGDELNFEQFDLAEIMNVNSNNNNNTNTETNDVFNFKSNLMKRVENKNNNMKIQISKKELLRQESFNLEVDDELKGLITPGITNVCQEFLKSLPTPSIPTLELNTNDLLIELQTTVDDCNNQELSPIKDYSAEKNPFVSALSADINLQQQQPVLQQLQTVTLDQLVFEDITPFDANTSLTSQTQKQISVETVILDHDYTSTTSKKRKISTTFDDESNNSEFSFDNSNTSFATTVVTTTTTNKKQKVEATTSTTAQKRKRVKGIYRANDVKTQEELENYRERRRKNNISSKQSRLTKKNLYLSMEEKSDQLEKDNDRLKQQITHLENLTKLLKDVLLQRFTSNIK